MSKKLLAILISLLVISYGEPPSFTIAEAAPDAPAAPQAPGAPALATYYIDPDGDDTNGDGSEGNPWSSLYKACSEVTEPGNSIFVNAGTYSETQRCELAAGVSIQGEGDDASILTYQFTNDWASAITLHSDAEGTDGDQSISYLRLDGLNTAWSAVQINARSNVNIHHCTFVDFRHSGVTFNGKVLLYDPVPPDVYATGNQFHHNTVSNCAEFVFESYGAGGLQIGGQEGMRIYDNAITQNSRDDGYNGYCIKYYNDGFNRDLKIYGNTLVREAPTVYAWDWNFAIELWYSRGAIEINNNTIVGSIDIAHGEKGAYDYTADIHHNIIGYETLQGESTSANNGGVFLERELDGVYVRNNIFRNVGTPLQIYPSETDLLQDFYIQYNLFNQVGLDGDGTSEALLNWSTVDGQRNVILDNFNFVNNTVYAGDGGAGTGLRLPNIGTATNVTVRNNIFDGFAYYPITSNLDNGASITGLSIENNIFHGNGNDFVYYGGTMPTDITEQNNLTDDPLFVSTADLHVSPGSPAIGAGLPLPWLTTDLEGTLVGNPPTIGCYEAASPISLTKSVQPASAAPGERITYTIAFSNSSGIDVTGVMITDAIPSAIVEPAFTSSGVALTQVPGTTYAWNVPSLPQGQGGVITVSGVLTSPLAAGALLNSVTLAVSGTLKTADAELTVQNVAPVADAGTDQSVGTNAMITLHGSGSDANGDALVYGWVQTGGPGVTLNNAATPMPSFTAPASAGVLTFTLTVTDTAGLAHADETVISVIEGGLGYTSSPPAGSTIDVGRVKPGSTVTATLTVSKTGEGTLNILDLDVSGPHAADFDVSPGSFSIGDSVTVQVMNIACTPTGPGLRTATLAINHNAAGSPATYTLNCTGQASAVYLPLIWR